MSSELKPHQQRVVDEADELRTRLEKLSAFIGGEVYLTLDEGERSRLSRQAAVMCDYLDILTERIAAFS